MYADEDEAFIYFCWFSNLKTDERCPGKTTITGLVSQSLDPATLDSEFMQIKYHKNQANHMDYSHECLEFTFEKWQANNVIKHMDTP